MPEQHENPRKEIEVRIYSLATMFTESIVFMEEINGDRLLPIWIGNVEGQAIAIRFSGIVLPRPLTHDLILTIIKETGFSVKKIVISELKENTFYAEIHLGDAGKIITIDSRPSDALALSVRSACPIFITDKIFNSAQTLSKPITEDEVKRFKEDLKDLKPKDIFGKLTDKDSPEKGGDTGS